MEKTNFKDWYKKKFDPKGFLYPSAPVDIGFRDMCDRVDEYLMEYANQKQPTPTDEEIVKEARKFEDYREEDAELVKHESIGRYHGFVKGAKWLRDTYQPTEQQNEKHLDEEIIQKLAGMLNEKMIHPEKDVDLLLEELQNIGLFFNEDDPYWYSDGE